VSNPRDVQRASLKRGARARVGGKRKAPKEVSQELPIDAELRLGAEDLFSVRRLLSDQLKLALAEKNYAIAGSIAEDYAKVLTALRQIRRILPGAAPTGGRSEAGLPRELEGLGQ
jgi:hypothetical protein